MLTLKIPNIAVDHAFDLIIYWPVVGYGKRGEMFDGCPLSYWITEFKSIFIVYLMARIDDVRSFFWWAIPIAWLYDIEEGAACNHSSIFFLLQFHNVACGVLFIFSPIRWLYNLWLMRYRNWKIRFFMFCFADVPSECFIHASYWLFRIHRLDDHGSIRPFCHRLAHFAFPVIDVLFRRRTAAGRRPWGRTVPWPRQVQNPARRRRTVDFSAMGCAHSFATAIRKQCRCQCLCKKKYWN